MLDCTSEQHLTLPHEIAAVLAVPTGTGPMPAVLMLHGFASHKDEVGNLYRMLAGQLTANGIASLRFDFCGWGDSGGRMEDTTIQGQIEDAVTAYQYLTGLTYIDPARVGVIGFSLGAAIAVCCAARHPDWFKAMMLWSGTGDLSDAFRTHTAYAMDQLVEPFEIDLGWRKITLKKQFFSELAHYDLQQAATVYWGAAMLIAGSEDGSAAYIDRYFASFSGKHKQALLLPGADHIFGVLGEDQRTAHMVLDKTCQWFRETLLKE